MHEFAIDLSKPSSSFILIAPSNTDYVPNENGQRSLDELIQSKIKADKRFFGIEISPAAKGEDLDYNKFAVQPLFTSITWLFDDNLKYASMSMAPAIQLGKVVEKCSPVLMHLTCYKFNEAMLREFLDIGFNNILTLKGDSNGSSHNQPWTYAIDLIKAIRKVNANATIGVAGYPEVHRLAKSRADDLQRLKEKVDAGAKFIITNACFKFEYLIEFIRSCRAIGITVPIIPGIFVPASYESLHKMLNICNVNVPPDQMVLYELYKNDSQRFITYAIENAVDLLTQLFTFDEHQIHGVQFFTLNKYEHIFEVVKRCDFANK